MTNELNAKPNWEAINACQLWPLAGSEICETCTGLTKCWGPDSLPQPEEERR